jgi:hypothetical protein
LSLLPYYIRDQANTENYDQRNHQKAGT